MTSIREVCSEIEDTYVAVSNPASSFSLIFQDLVVMTEWIMEFGEKARCVATCFEDVRKSWQRKLGRTSWL